MEPHNHHHPPPFYYSQRAHEALLRAGPRLKPLQQVHAHLLITGSHSNLSLITKLTLLSCAAASIAYTRRLFLSISNPDQFLFSSLITSFSKNRFPNDAVLLYRRMLVTIPSLRPSSYVFTAVIKSCGELSALRVGRVVHCHALVRGYWLDSYVEAALVAFYAKCGDLVCARKAFDEMPERTVVAWNSMVSGYEQNGFSEKAIVLFHQMRDSGVGFDLATLVSVLSACSQVGALELGCWVHDRIRDNGYDMNVVIGTSLINMYARCGNVSRAREVFDLINDRNVVSWTAMISGYGMNGYGREAVELFDTMRARGPPPNDVTFVAVLSACAHAGLVQEGRKAFASMSEDFGLVPGMEHHVCMVDMLGRAGLLSEAFEYIKRLDLVKPAPAVWTAMLGACKMHRNFEFGVRVADHLLAAEPENPSHYVLISNVYALAGKMDQAEAIRNRMIQKGLKKGVGYSTIEVNQKTYLFSMGDKSHPDTIAIYESLDELMKRISEAGYVPVPESVMHELEEEEKEYEVRYHSEKLAIAFGMLNTSHGIPVRVVKNLRMCEDCHSAIKFISAVTQREIIVRDKLRFHHFTDGSCSCADYW
ncbi:pentatricopeptide repeat-containing protein At2g33760 [Rhododendron vialii]|uniref:pentatricopeptide repeat-containing protein At2g33760 n=1 Tax=Rhododendron vialii TaxID=182163 RepID=UPI002660496C|nr:pentatricopeptide repeat-containing protein At2g33760 [Rhododendron vialii]